MPKVLQREQGVVKCWLKDKGYGFIQRAAGEKDIFVHHTAIESEGLRRLTEGQLVSFFVGKNDRGTIAENVIVSG